MVSICVLAFASVFATEPGAYKCWNDPDGEAVMYAVDRCTNMVTEDKCVYLPTPSSNVHYFLLRPKKG